MRFVSKRTPPSPIRIQLEETPMADSLAALREELSLANRILAHEGIVDAFGHISVRHPGDPNRFFISRHRAPELVTPAETPEYTLDPEPVHAVPAGWRHYG